LNRKELERTACFRDPRALLGIGISQSRLDEHREAVEKRLLQLGDSQTLLCTTLVGGTALTRGSSEAHQRMPGRSCGCAVVIGILRLRMPDRFAIRPTSLRMTNLESPAPSRVPHPFVFCERWAARISISNSFPETYRSEVPTLAKNARVGQPPS
jgi:hypothetical protein